MSAKDAGIVARWTARLAIRKALLAYAQRQYSYWYQRWRDAVVWNLSDEERSRRWQLMKNRRAKRDKRRNQVEYAQRVIARHKTGYTVVSRKLTPWRTGGYGGLGSLDWVTVHHDAAHPPPSSMAGTRSRLRQYDRHHASMWGGGIGYHEAIDVKGRVWPLRSPGARGAHVGGHNTHNYGIMLLGNFEVGQPTSAQLATLKARLTDPPRSGLPDLRGKRVRGHNDWPGPTNRTACPGRNLKPHVRDLPRYTA